MDSLTIAEIADMCGGTFTGPGGKTVRRISKDTRTLVPGDLYLALRGDNHDGNRYALAAIEKGAAAALLDDSSMASQVPSDVPVILVSDSLLALQRFASAWRDRLALKVACITGSSGKTSTKEFTAAVLSARYRVTKTDGNLNNHIGLPLSILSASASDDAAVWEIGMNHPGEIQPLAHLARPDLGIVTNIGVAHIEYMGSRESIAEEKGALVEEVSPSGAVILPSDDDFVDVLSKRSRARIVLAGLKNATITATDIRMDTQGSRFLLWAHGEFVDAQLSAPGEHMVRNALLAVAAGLESGLSLEECRDGLAAARLVGGRLSRRNVRGVTVLDDTYNANPDSMEAALITLGCLEATGHRFAVLGKMGELGTHATASYQRVGEAAARSVQTLITVGPETASMIEAARGSGLSEVHLTSSTEEAADLLRQLTRQGDIVLVKGSRVARMERVIQHFEN